MEAAREQCQFGLWGCLVVSWRPFLSADASIFARELCVYFSREWLVCFLQILPTEATLLRHINSPQDVPFALPTTAVQTLYIILFERFYFRPNLYFMTNKLKSSVS